MGILSEIASKAKNLIKSGNVVNRRTKVYDATKNKVIVAGITLDGMVEVELSTRQVTKQDQGVHRSYYTYYTVDEPQILTVNILPTAKCNDILELLESKQREIKGYFTLYVSENGNIVDIYKSHILSLPSKNMQSEANNRQYVFGLYKSPVENIMFEEIPDINITG